MKFMHICPTKYLERLVSKQTSHLLLAHLIEKDDSYRNWYRYNKKMRPSDLYILDNSAFEMYKEGRPMYSSDKLIEMGQHCSANYIVMSDYPNEPSSKTIKSAEILAPKFREVGFSTFFCPQSKIGDFDDLIECFLWALSSEHVDYIGFSILAIPNAYGVEADNGVQRFLTRWKFCHYLHDKYNFFVEAKQRGKKIHFLGMTDGPNEIKLMGDRLAYIDSWDSSAAIWAGFNNIGFDKSPTGLIEGKVKISVDFDIDNVDNDQLAIAINNMNYIDDLARGFKMK